jgi:hypothetical protein
MAWCLEQGVTSQFGCNRTITKEWGGRVVMLFLK